MINITQPEALLDLPENNKFLGTPPAMKNSVIRFNGSGNILFCEEGVSLSKCTITFNGNDCVIFLCKNKHDYKLKVTVYNKSAFFVGRDNYFNGVLNAILSERKHLFIGNSGLFSFDIWIRSADPHLIYDAISKQRINPSKSVFLGDHVWVGQGALILKGTHIHSGSIVGAGSVVPGKKIASNTSWGGNPARELRQNVFWTERCVHGWSEAQTEESQSFDKDAYIYKNDPQTRLPFEEIDRRLTEAADANERYEYLQTLTKDVPKNRFALEPEHIRSGYFKSVEPAASAVDMTNRNSHVRKCKLKWRK